MDSWAEEVLAMAKQLPPRDRLRIAEALQKSGDEDEHGPAIEAAWNEEIARRAEQVLRGEATLVDGVEVFARIRAKYAR